ncbi:hypothetical protein CRE_06855 [Caenorhabditis remanei]|uniref:BTB domain-containing protein n=1 Tax=Caenorhabditis remanei TaxID=31234 RepID=E3MZM0_CAERE|nr:hypothetical protein CRE_06855 [Caenorhabditis remanei]
MITFINSEYRWGAVIIQVPFYYRCRYNTVFTVTDGITCVWKGIIKSYHVMHFTWKFDWNKLKNQGVDELTGHISVVSNYNWFTTTRIDVKLTKNKQEIIKQVQCQNYYDDVSYVYSLTPHYAPTPRKLDCPKMFQPSELNDTILVVEGKKLHVNKTFLSYHSEYFRRALFSSNFKESQMDEIPIGDVSYEDFALLLSSFYPNPVFPTDATVEKLLELARRFLVSSVISIIEYHLMNVSKITHEKMLWMADEYGMPNLVEKCIRELDTLEKAKKLKQSDEYGSFSDGTKAKVLDHLMDLI